MPLRIFWTAIRTQRLIDACREKQQAVLAVYVDMNNLKIINDWDGGGDEVLEYLYQKFEKYNERSDKEYNITVSAGACVLQPDRQITLKEALLQADERLYLVKQKRKKDVAKHH